MKTKRFISMGLMFALTLCTFAEPKKSEQKLHLVVDGIETIGGHLYVAIYTKNDYMKKAQMGFKVDVTDSTMEFDVDGLKSGTYAIALFQDLNGNSKLDTGIFGIPTEKYGFSNNAKGFMGSPSFKKAKFSFPKNKTVRINVN